MSRFRPEDDLLHDISDAPHGRESLLWTAPLPAEGLLVFVYAWRDADTDRYGRFVCAAEEAGGKPAFLDLEDGIALEGTDLDRFGLAGLEVAQPEPLRVAELAFERPDLAYHARFEGLHEPFSWHENADGCAPWAARDRYEQSCRVTGVLRLGDREVAIDGFGHRDHSWGTRDWRALQHWKWINAGTDDGLTIHAWVSFALGDRQVNGYVNRSGQVSPLVAVEAHADLDGDMLQRRVTATLTDAEGRTTALEAERRAIWQMPIQHLYLNEAAMAGTLDGRPASVHVELGWPQAYVDAYLVDA